MCYKMKTMTLIDTLRLQKDTINALAARYGARRIRVFGSIFLAISLMFMFTKEAYCSSVIVAQGMYLKMSEQENVELCMLKENFTKEWLEGKDSTVWLANMKNFYEKGEIFQGKILKVDYKGEKKEWQQKACLSIHFQSPPKINFDYQTYDGAASDDGEFVISLKKLNPLHTPTDNQGWHYRYALKNEGLNFFEFKNILDVLNKNFNTKTCYRELGGSKFDSKFQVIELCNSVSFKNNSYSNMIVFQCEGPESGGDYREDYTRVYFSNLDGKAFEQFFSGHDVGWLNPLGAIDVNGDGVPEFTGVCGYRAMGIFQVFPKQKWLFCEQNGV